jgi:hypothetical protein
MRKIVLIMVLFILSINFISYANAASEVELLAEAKSLYLKLLKFKDYKEFHEVGFGVCCTYNKWLVKVSALRDKPNADRLFKHGFVAGDIEMLGMKYMKSNGRETEYTRDMNNRLRAAFNITTSKKSTPKGKTLIVRNEDLACMKMEYFNRTHKALLDKNYALASKYPSPPTCIDLYVGTKVEGPLERAKSKYLSTKFVKVKYNYKIYWAPESMFSDD